MKALIEKRNELAAKQAELSAIFKETGPDLDLALVKILTGDTKAKSEEIKRRNDELAALAKEVEGLAAIEKAAAESKARDEYLKTPVSPIVQPSGQQVLTPPQKSLGQMFIESKTYTERKGNHGPVSQVEGVELKTLMSTAAGWAPESIRQPGYIPHAERIPNIIDVIPFKTTQQAAVVYMLETTFTNNAAERTEGANNAGEGALALTQTTNTVREIVVWIPVTREQMDDVSYAQGYVNDRLTLMLRQRLETQIMAGNGVAPNLAGLIGLSGAQTQAKGADPTLDCIYKAIVAGRVTGRVNPNAVIMHPNDWMDIRLTRTADGIYIMGNPGDAGVTRVWGLPVFESTACTENTGVVTDTAYMDLVQKQGIEFEYTDSHASLFIQRTLAILATIRAAFVVYRPATVVQCTGI